MEESRTPKAQKTACTSAEPNYDAPVASPLEIDLQVVFAQCSALMSLGRAVNSSVRTKVAALQQVFLGNVAIK